MYTLCVVCHSMGSFTERQTEQRARERLDALFRRHYDNNQFVNIVLYGPNGEKLQQRFFAPEPPAFTIASWSTIDTSTD